jgi:hypothetical protein
MKMLNKKFIAAGIIVAMMVIFAFNSCQKEDTSGFVQMATVASVHLSADLDINHFFSVLHKAVYDTALNNSNASIIDSAKVTRTFDTISGKTVYTFYYADGTTSPDFKEKSGTFQAFLKNGFDEPGATIEVMINNFIIDGRSLQGTLNYTYQGNNKYTLESTVVFSGEGGLQLTYTGNKEIVWTEGMANPLKPSEHKFTLSGNTRSNYVDENNKALPIAEIVSETDGAWNISFSCNKLIKNGALSITFILPDGAKNITGQFQDADIDGCSDKVMLKNTDGFGFPCYI